MASTGERFPRADALRVAEAIARKFGEPHPNLPKILEFIIYGSTANGTKDTVGDLDFGMFIQMPENHQQLINLPDRLEEIESELRKSGVQLPYVDFFPILIDVVWDSEIQDRYRRRMMDPNQIPNMLRNFLRWDVRAQKFVPANQEYLKKYKPRDA